MGRSNKYVTFRNHALEARLREVRERMFHEEANEAAELVRSTPIERAPLPLYQRVCEAVRRPGW